MQVSILQTQQQAIIGDDGAFVIAGLALGDYTLRANAVGCRLISFKFSLAAGEAIKDFEITLTPDNFTRTDKVDVKGDIFQGSDSPAILEMNLTAEEIRQTSTVLADDPFRSIQMLPGVSAAGNNDFFAQFSVMGAQYQNVGIYLDGILVPAPFHGVDITQGATLSIFTSETLFANYRLTPTLNLGGKFLFGSGYPVPGGEDNPMRLGDYQRLDVRAEKDWTFRRWKLAAYGELRNATNHYNPRYFYTNYNSWSVVTGQGLPITPTAGVAFEF